MRKLPGSEIAVIITMNPKKNRENEQNRESITSIPGKRNPADNRHSGPAKQHDPSKINPTKSDPDKTDPSKIDPATVDPTRIEPPAMELPITDPAKPTDFPDKKSPEIEKNK